MLLGNGDGTFQPPITYALGGSGSPTAIVAGDFNGDGRTRPGRSPDTSPDDVSVLLGNGDGTFVDPGQFDHDPSRHAPGGRRQRRRHRRCPGRRRGRRYPLSPGHPRAARHLRAARHGQPRLSPRATSPGSRTPIEGPCSPASTPRTTPSRSTPTATAASSGSARSRPASSRRRSSRPT